MRVSIREALEARKRINRFLEHADRNNKDASEKVWLKFLIEDFPLERKAAQLSVGMWVLDARMRKQELELDRAIHRAVKLAETLETYKRSDRRLERAYRRMRRAL